MLAEIVSFSLTESIRAWALWAINQGGLGGAGVLMALESMVAPVPSEVVMPPLGMLLHQGRFGTGALAWTKVIAVTSAGSLAGSLISYYLGYFGGKPLVLKVGKWFLLNEHHLDLTTRWFHRYGGLTVFIARFIPIVRHFISIPAGIARMSFLRFCGYTLVGAALWNSFLLWLGYHLEKHWEDILKYRGPIDIAVIAALVITVAVWAYLNLRRKKAAAHSVHS